MNEWLLERNTNKKIKTNSGEEDTKEAAAADRGDYQHNNQNTSCFTTMRTHANDDRQVSADGHGDDTDTNKAISNEGGGCRRCNKKHSSGDAGDGQEKKQSSKKKSKRRRRNSSSSRRRCIIPEARVVQLADEQAYISGSSSEEDEEMEALIRRDIRRFTRVFTPATHPEFFVFVNRNGHERE